MWPVVDLWLLTRRYATPFGGRVLPCPGAPAEQPAALLDVMAALDAAADADAKKESGGG